MRKKLFLTGAGGVVGRAVAREASLRGWEVHGLMRRERSLSEITHHYFLNLHDEEAMSELFWSVGPDAVVHTAAERDPNRCERDPQSCQKINVDVSFQLCSLAAEADIPLLFTSSDLVFDGSHQFWREGEHPRPLSVYGEQKRQVEEFLFREHPAKGIAARVALVMDRNGGFLPGMITALQRGESLNLFQDEYRTPVSSSSLAKGILLAIEAGYAGPLHLGGAQRLSRYEMGRVLCQLFGFSQELLLPRLSSELSLGGAPRPLDVSLSIERARALGFSPHSFEDEVIALFR